MKSRLRKVAGAYWRLSVIFLTYSTWLELCLRHAPDSASRRVWVCSPQRFLVYRFEAVYGAAHRHVIVASLSEPATL